MSLTPSTIQRRVKLYELNDSGQWDDRGTGFAILEQDHTTDTTHLIVTTEGDNSEVLLHHRVDPAIDYQRQGQTILTWSEDSGADMALSFQDIQRCTEVWEFLQDLHGQFLAYDDGPDIPELSLETIGEVADLVDHMCSTQREDLGTMLREHDFLARLMSISREAVHTEDEEVCYRVFRILRAIFMTGDAVLLDDLTSPPYALDVLLALEYDPDMPQQISQMHRHRHYLSMCYFKNVCVITDEEVLARVHQSFILSYIRDVALLKYLDDAATSGITSLMYLKDTAIVSRLVDADTFREGLLSTLTSLARYTPAQARTPSIFHGTPTFHPLFPQLLPLAPPAFTSVITAAANVHPSALPHAPVDLPVVPSRTTSATTIAHMAHLTRNPVTPAADAADTSSAAPDSPRPSHIAHPAPGTPRPTTTSLRAIPAAELGYAALSQAAHRKHTLQLVSGFLRLAKTVQSPSRAPFYACVLDTAFFSALETMLSTTPRSHEWLWSTACEILADLIQHDVVGTKRVILTLPTRSTQQRTVTRPNERGRRMPVTIPAPSPFLALLLSALVSCHVDDGVCLQLSEIVRRLLSPPEGGDMLLQCFSWNHAAQVASAIDYNVEGHTPIDHAAAVRATSFATPFPAPYNTANSVALMAVAGPDAIITWQQLLHCSVLDTEPYAHIPSLALRFHSEAPSLTTPAIHALELLAYCARTQAQQSLNGQRLSTTLQESRSVLRASVCAHALVGTHLRKYVNIFEDDVYDDGRWRVRVDAGGVVADRDATEVPTASADTAADAPASTSTSAPTVTAAPPRSQRALSPRAMAERITATDLPLFPPSAMTLLCALTRFAKVLVLCNDHLAIRALASSGLIDILFLALVANGNRRNLLSGTVAELWETCECDDNIPILTDICAQWRRLVADTPLSAILRPEDATVPSLSDSGVDWESDGYFNSLDDVDEQPQPAVDDSGFELASLPSVTALNGDSDSDDDLPFALLGRSGSTSASATAAPSASVQSGAGHRFPNGAGSGGMAAHPSLSASPTGSPRGNPPSPPLSPSTSFALSRSPPSSPSLSVGAATSPRSRVSLALRSALSPGRVAMPSSPTTSVSLAVPLSPTAAIVPLSDEDARDDGMAFLQSPATAASAFASTADTGSPAGDASPSLKRRASYGAPDNTVKRVRLSLPTSPSPSTPPPAPTSPSTSPASLLSSPPAANGGATPVAAQRSRGLFADMFSSIRQNIRQNINKLISGQPGAAPASAATASPPASASPLAALSGYGEEEEEEEEAVSAPAATADSTTALHASTSSAASGSAPDAAAAAAETSTTTPTTMSDVDHLVTTTATTIDAASTHHSTPNPAPSAEAPVAATETAPLPVVTTDADASVSVSASAVNAAAPTVPAVSAVDGAPEVSQPPSACLDSLQASTHGSAPAPALTTSSTTTLTTTDTTASIDTAAPSLALPASSTLAPSSDAATPAANAPAALPSSAAVTSDVPTHATAASTAPTGSAGTAANALGETEQPVIDENEFRTDVDF